MGRAHSASPLSLPGLTWVATCTPPRPTGWPSAGWRPPSLTLDAFPVCVLDVLHARHDLSVHLQGESPSGAQWGSLAPSGSLPVPPTYPEGDLYPVFYTLLQHKRLLLEGLQVTWVWEDITVRGLPPAPAGSPL